MIFRLTWCMCRSHSNPSTSPIFDDPNGEESTASPVLYKQLLTGGSPPAVLLKQFASADGPDSSFGRELKEFGGQADVNSFSAKRFPHTHGFRKFIGSLETCAENLMPLSVELESPEDLIQISGPTVRSCQEMIFTFWRWVGGQSNGHVENSTSIISDLKHRLDRYKHHLHLIRQAKEDGNPNRKKRKERNRSNETAKPELASRIHSFVRGLDRMESWSRLPARKQSGCSDSGCKWGKLAGLSAQTPRVASRRFNILGGIILLAGAISGGLCILHRILRRRVHIIRHRTRLLGSQGQL
ncbi:hypothetical protein FQN57_001170 [Myotisia sp. PD_48]|nr:hypothetical protein FQN57_001170 [Myotisia sp. PD_48]